jgi:hypothetical protein
MAPLTRRGFIKTTSLSVAALGALGAVLPMPALAEGQAPGGAGTPSMSGTDTHLPPTAMLGGAPFMVYISDPSTGAGTILVGEQAIPFTNSTIVQALRQNIG